MGGTAGGTGLEIGCGRGRIGGGTRIGLAIGAVATGGTIIGFTNGAEGMAGLAFGIEGIIIGAAAGTGGIATDCKTGLSAGCSIKGITTAGGGAETRGGTMGAVFIGSEIAVSD